MKKISLIAVAVVLLILTTACSPDREAFETSGNLPGLVPNAPVSPAAPSINTVYEVEWNDPTHPNFISFSLKTGATATLNYSRVDIYSDVQCLELIDIVTPELLESSVVLWPMVSGVNHVAIIATTTNNVRLPCKVVASSSTATDVVPPVPPENFAVNYRWLNANSLEISASWSASADDPSGTEYTLYLMDDPNGYAAPLAAEYTTELSHTFVYTVEDPSLFLGTPVFLHLIANDQAANHAPAIVDSGFFISNTAPVLDFRITYLDRGGSGLEINLSGTCTAGQDVLFHYSNTEMMDLVTPASASCPYGTFSVSFPTLYTWYQDRMVVFAQQLDNAGVVTEYPQAFVSEMRLDSNLKY